ncbi:MAG TPA: alpha/beta hydrolase [Candidatus Acidoferrum sp.]|nr:alpha/beta hydrolase [Candidatus Acidoferrum sp.]
MTHVLFLPGLACDEEVWSHQARRLSEIATVRIANYGSSDSLKKMAEVALRHAPARFALAGHSMGGRVAFEIVRRVPERVSGLALLDTAYRPFAGGDHGERERAERLRLVDIARSQGMRAMARDWVQNMVHPSRLRDKVLIDSIIEMLARMSPEIYAGQIKALLERPNATPVLSTIRCPTLVLCGREDSWSTLLTHKEMAARIPQSKLVVIENCGHMAPMERPEKVTSALVSWLEFLRTPIP